MDETKDELEVGRIYAIRIENGLYLEPATYVGRAPYEFGPRDPRTFRRKAWALEEDDGWWRAAWSWDVRMSWEDYLGCRRLRGRSDAQVSTVTRRKARASIPLEHHPPGRKDAPKLAPPLRQLPASPDGQHEGQDGSGGEE